MQAAPQRRAYQTLDGLRAVGAFLVVMRHVPWLFGPIRVPESFLAVDLFYLISGFVVAHAYGERLKAGGFVGEFVKTRLIRLYPLYLIGLVVGVAAALASLYTDPHSFWTPTELAVAISTGLLMIPRFPGLSVNGSTLDGPIWTLLYELIANFAYAAAIRVLTIRVLWAVVIVCGLGVVYAELRYHTLDVGYSLTDQWGALARVGFSFFMGVLVFRLVGDWGEVKSGWISWACVAALTIGLALQPSRAQMAFCEIGMILVGMPALVVVASRFEPGPLSGRLFSFIGLMSYAVYLVHQPLGNLMRTALSHVGRVPTDARGLVFGAAFLVFLVGFSWALDVFYDAPVRKVLRAWFMAAPRKPLPASPAPAPGPASEAP